MKRFLLGVVFCVGAGFSWAQPFPPSAADEALQEAPASSIDLLKRTAATSKVAASASSARSLAQAAAVQAARQQEAAPAKQEAQPAQPEPAAPQTAAAAPQSVVEKPAAAPVQLTAPKASQTAVSSKTKMVRRVASRNKRRPVQARTATSAAVAPAPSTAATPAEAEPVKAEDAAEEEIQSAEDAAAEAELEYAARMLEESKKQAEQSGRNIPPQAAKNTARTIPAPNKAFNPNTFRPGVEWKKSESTHFTIYTQKRDKGISSSNMAMTFESAYDTLRRFIPWMMSGKVRVFVYQDYQSYLKHEPQAKAWTRALAYPTRGEIVVYDEPGKTRELKETFTHELTHIFTQQFFDKHHTNRIMTPAWLDEGLAVFMEDQAYNGRHGGPWSRDLKTVNFIPAEQSRPAAFGVKSASSRIKHFSNGKKQGKPVQFLPFDEFMQEGSLEAMEAQNRTQDWYLQAYAMVRFLLNPAGGASPSNRMQFQQFTTLMGQGEPLRNSSGFLVKDKKGQTVYQPYSSEKAISKAFHYANTSTFEDSFWRWAEGVKRR